MENGIFERNEKEFELGECSSNWLRGGSIRLRNFFGTTFIFFPLLSWICSTHVASLSRDLERHLRHLRGHCALHSHQRIWLESYPRSNFRHLSLFNGKYSSSLTWATLEMQSLWPSLDTLASWEKLDYEPESKLKSSNFESVYYFLSVKIVPNFDADSTFTKKWYIRCHK